MVDSACIAQGKTVKIKNTVNPSVLGGLVVDFGEKTVDLSVASKVNRMNSLLTVRFTPLFRLIQSRWMTISQPEADIVGMDAAIGVKKANESSFLVGVDKSVQGNPTSPFLPSFLSTVPLSLFAPHAPASSWTLPA